MLPIRVLGLAVCGIALSLAVCTNNRSDAAEEKKPGKKAKAGKVANGSPARRDEIMRRLRERINPTVELPKNIEWIATKQVDGRTNLAFNSGKNLGSPLAVEDLEKLIATELVAEGVEKATKKVSDDQFVRRVYLDIIGQLPAPADLDEYVADRSPDKKAKLVDYLLSQPAYGTNWARYWRDVIAYRETAGANKLVPYLGFEDWMAEQLNSNRGWDTIVSDILTTNGLNTEHPEGFFFAAHDANPAQMAGETARIFLGIQIACAECHDHTTDVWKRDQFHELASFFGKTGIQQRRDLMDGQQFPRVFEIGEKRRGGGEYRKPDLKNPTDPGEVVQPVFLSGQPLPLKTSESQRREAVSTLITSKRNPYFAKAFVNRVWSEFMGFGFTNPVDDLGSQQPVAYPEVFDSLARSFAASDYDIKQLIRTIALSRVYDRRFQEFEGSYEDEILFQAVIPSRMSADQIFEAVDWVLGDIDDGGGAGYGPRQRGARSGFREAFGFDPSLDKEELEASIPQALVMINNPKMHERITASRPGNLLNKLMNTQDSDRGVVEMLYARVLARKPKAEEITTCLAHVREASSKEQGFEDVLWALLNSTEFLHNH